MRKSKRERAESSPFVQSRREQVEQIIADERQKERQKMTLTGKVIARLNYGQVPVEIEILSEDENEVTPDEIKAHIDFYISQGFAAPSYSRGGDGNIGKRGTVTSLKPVEGTKMFEATGSLDDNGGEFKWRVFDRNAARKGDRFEVVKNDRGFKEGNIILEDDEQLELPL